MVLPAVLERRPLAGTTLAVSVLGLVVDPLTRAPASDERAVVAFLRDARASGVTTFDLASARFPAWSAHALIEAFPRRDPDVVVFVGEEPAPAARGFGRAGPRGTANALPGSSAADAGRLLERLSRVGSVVRERNPETKPDPPTNRPRAEPGATDGAIELLTRLPARGSEPLEPSEIGEPPVTTELSLLELDRLGPLATRFHSTPGAVVVRDPFAGGRLDGSRFASELSERGPGTAPPDVRRLEAEFAPVLRLAPLTKDRRRTLAQAAVQYLVSWPWVATVLVPMPAPGRWEELRKSALGPPLSSEELTALGIPTPPHSSDPRDGT